LRHKKESKELMGNYLRDEGRREKNNLRNFKLKNNNLELYGLPNPPLLSLADVVKDTLYDVMHILLFAGICAKNPQNYSGYL
jgi:hypothetical protein